MISGILLILILYPITQHFLKKMKRRFPWMEVKMLQNLYWYHTLFAIVYYIYALSNPSDSVEYYLHPQRLSNWLEIYDTGSPFMHFICYPLINYFHFSYEMLMVLFSWLGYWGFVYFYIFFKENIRFKHVWHGFDLVKLMLFLPNMHYWSASMGKGSFIFLGIALMAYGLSKLNERKLALIIGLAIIYHIRPHIFFVFTVGIILGLFTGRERVPTYQKYLVLAGSAAALILLFDKIMAFSQLDTSDLVGSFDQFTSHRSNSLAQAKSGIKDISSYPFPLKLLTFWYRPLFIDAPSFTGLIVSIENTFYVLITFKLFDKKFIKFISTSPAIIKTGLIIYVGVSAAMCGTLSNLGLIIRQKTMIMYFFLFIILAFLDYKKGVQLAKRKSVAVDDTPPPQGAIPSPV